MSKMLFSSFEAHFPAHRPQSSQFVGQSQSCWHDRSSLDDLDQPTTKHHHHQRNFTKFSTGDFAASRHFGLAKE